jgi:competence protein ComEC
LNLRKLLLALIGSLIVVSVTFLFLSKDFSFSPKIESENLKVHFIDVGQGDATLLEGPDFTVLIDAGRHDRNDVVPYLQSLEINEIDLLVGTHPHADHIGQFPQVLENYPVKEVWMSGDLHTTITFEKTLDAIEKTNANYKEPRAGYKYELGSVIIDVIHPKEVNGDLNNGSIVVRLQYFDAIFLFTGDAELQAENEILKRGYNLKSHVLKVGHHGSISSSSKNFLNKVDPEIAIYSAAEDNIYGHPDQKVIERLFERGIMVFGTDINGSIIVTTDGNMFNIKVSNEDSVKFDSIVNCVNINTAKHSELTEILNIGSDRAIELIHLRPFSSLKELTKIDGISSARLTDIIDQGKACIN